MVPCLSNTLEVMLKNRNMLRGQRFLSSNDQ